MNPTIITAIAAACGSLVGAVATIVTTWITLRTHKVLAEREAKLRHREALYGDFITEASRLTIENQKFSQDRRHSSGHRYIGYGVRRKWKLFYEVYPK